MADAKKIKISGTWYNVKDEVARNGLAAKQDKLTFDTTPTASSTKPVTSGGVKTALDGKVNKSGDTMTGTLTISGEGKTLKFVPADTSKMSLAQIVVRNNERLMFWHRTSGEDGNELYLLPAIDTSATGNNYYDILTSKIPVTTAQGGTGGNDSEWQTYTNSSVFTGTIYYRRVGALFEICSSLYLKSELSAKSYVKLMTVPSEYMPSKEIYPTCYANTEAVNNRLLAMRLSYNGDLYLYANGSDVVKTTYNLYFSGFGF